MTVTDEIKDRLDMVEVVGESVKLRKSGKNYTGFCPFHPNTRTPAFVVFPETGTWRCFGACNEGGDIFSFVMKKEGWDFSETLRNLAQRAGVELRPFTPEQEEQQEAHERLRELLETAIAFYRHHLLETSAGDSVLEYLHRRGLTDGALETFEIGYSPQSWDATMRFAMEKGFSQEDLIRAGMLSERESGGYYDRFRHRIMIPIRDLRGRMAGFGARIVDPEDIPKFLNSPQTEIFDKGRLLYGLDKARRAIRSSGKAIIVEGYMDVIGLHQAGFANVVSPMGIAITESQLRQVRRFSRRIILALDPDAAGLQATLRGLTLARVALHKQTDPVFDSRGWVGHEGRLDADIRVVTLPQGLDPDEVVAHDPDAWPALIERAQTVVSFVLDTLTAGRDLEDPKTKAEIAAQILPLIEDVPDSVEREAYRQHLARRLRVDERALLDWRPRRRKSGRFRRVPSAAFSQEESPKTSLATVLESFCLGVLLRDPELLYLVDRQLQALGLEKLASLDFAGSERQIIFQAVREALSQEDQEPAQYWQNTLAEVLREVAEEMIGEVRDLDLNRPRVRGEILANFLRLRKRNQEARLSHLQFNLQSVQEAAPGQEMIEASEISELKRQVLKLAQDRARLESAIAQRQGAMHNLPVSWE